MCAVTNIHLKMLTRLTADDDDENGHVFADPLDDSEPDAVGDEFRNTRAVVGVKSECENEEPASTVYSIQMTSYVI